MLFTILTLNFVFVICIKKIQVRASALFIPELSMTALDFNCYWFAFSIRMSLNLGGCIVNGMRFDSCQLCMARWTIQENNGIVTKITEETVEGKVKVCYNTICPRLLSSRKLFFPTSRR